MAFRPPALRTILTILGLLLAIVVLSVIVSHQDLETQRAILSEQGIIERLSAAGYVLAAVLLGARIVRMQQPRRWPLVIVLLAMAGRELDMDKLPFTKGLLKSRQYIGPDVPMGEKLISAALLIGLLLVVFLCLRRYGRAFLGGLMKGSAPAWYVVTGVFLIVATKSIDGIGRKLAPLGITVAQETERTLSNYEEIGELGIVIAFILAIVSIPRPRAKPVTVAAQSHSKTE